MKQVLLYISIIFLLSSCSKSGFSDLLVQAPHIKLPLAKLGNAEDTIHTYSLDIDRKNIEELYELGNSFVNMKNRVKLQGFKEVSKEADVMITMFVGTGYFFDKGMKSMMVADKKGREHEVYYREMEYSNLVKYNVYNPDTSLFEEVIVLNREKRNTYLSRTFKTVEECDKWWYKNGNAEVNELKSALIKSGFDAINSELNLHFGFIEASGNVEFKTIKDSNHKDFRKFEANNKIVEGAFNQLKPNNTEKYQKKIQPAIEFWIAKLPDYDTANENFIRYACLFNITMAYYWMDDFISAKLYANKLIAEETNDVEAKRIYELIVRTENHARSLGLSGVHFSLPETLAKR